MTQDLVPQAGDCFDVFVVRGRRAGKLVGYLCKATALWNGETQLLPYSRSPDLGGFAISTAALKHGVKLDGRKVHYYTRRRAS